MIKINLKHSFVEKDVKDFNKNRVQEIHNMIENKTGAGNDFLGWVEWPSNYDKNEYAKMKQVAISLRNEIETLLVIGIGGSYLGARAAEEMIRGLYNKDKVEIIFVGNTISSTYMANLVDYLKNKEFGIVNVSKSGTTTEPGIAFRVFEEILIKEKGQETAKKRIVAVTDKAKGALKTLADSKGYESFVIPDDIGGRYSVLTPVGIFALMVCGIDTDVMMKGALRAQKDLNTVNNTAYEYAVARYLLHTQKKFAVEVLVSYELQMQVFTEWWKQLFGESEGKDGKGLYPSSCVFSTDLHSLGQFIQEGTKNLLFETVIRVKTPQQDLSVPKLKDDLDGLNYLTNKSFHEINNIALEGVIDAHTNDGKVPNIILDFEKMDSEMFGYASYWFMKACAMSAYLLEINPFNQPGVEIYKKNMFKLLKKPGY
ncbi:glucose-6-phosphate isomerase [Spiroplasma endosymbiont of Crioceris asparagi]|uniref:glucose-6-phosphate isomerase n=1 Tax=Spiroplasma endosymbiont of Crioceris asparagi TaxID=3066286 RepID=UPI0030D516E1